MLLSDIFEVKFGKEITFRQLYDLLQRHKQYVFNRKIPQWSCLCEICENAIFLANGINKKLFFECRLPETIRELVAKFSCNDIEDCMTGKREVCSSTKLTCDNFNSSSDSDSTSDDSSDTNEESHCDGDSIRYYKWGRCDDNKLQKVFFKASIDESIHLLNSTIKTLKHHIHVKRVQFKFYNDAKANLAKNEILIHVDYSESYENKQQREIQSAYFGHTTFSIFTACCYLRDVENKVISESVTIASELSDHSRAAAITCILKIIDHLREKHQHLPLKINAVIWGDVCSAHFRSRFVFKLLASINSSINITWCYNE